MQYNIVKIVIYIDEMISLKKHAVKDCIEIYKANILPGLVMKQGTVALRRLSENQEVLIA